jgi:DNA-binding MarR family transcriptional regulator
MNRDWHKDVEIRRPTAAAFLPPPTVEETSWDILLALHSDRRTDLNLGKLAARISVHPAIAGHWLGLLEDRGLVAEAKDPMTGDPRAVLTSAGRELLDRYLAATSDLDARTH